MSAQEVQGPIQGGFPRKTEDLIHIDGISAQGISDHSESGVSGEESTNKTDGVKNKDELSGQTHEVISSKGDVEAHPVGGQDSDIDEALELRAISQAGAESRTQSSSSSDSGTGSPIDSKPFDIDPECKACVRSIVEQVSLSDEGSLADSKPSDIDAECTACVRNIVEKIAISSTESHTDSKHLDVDPDCTACVRGIVEQVVMNVSDAVGEEAESDELTGSMENGSEIGDEKNSGTKGDKSSTNSNRFHPYSRPGQAKWQPTHLPVSELVQNRTRFRKNPAARKYIPEPTTSKTPYVITATLPRFDNFCLGNPPELVAGAVDTVWQENGKCKKLLPRHISSQDYSFKLDRDYQEEYCWSDKEKAAWNDQDVAGRWSVSANSKLAAAKARQAEAPIHNLNPTNPPMVYFEQETCQEPSGSLTRRDEELVAAAYARHHGALSANEMHYPSDESWGASYELSNSGWQSHGHSSYQHPQGPQSGYDDWDPGIHSNDHYMFYEQYPPQPPPRRAYEMPRAMRHSPYGLYAAGPRWSRHPHYSARW